ncbi:lathosterol oxidase-like [Centruroides vittatus]|uniref:lathosterol oxidase-like n=1 Tax=Centruroides vittatus TaxID=120091 RepID=UPI0035108C12
MKFIKTLQEYQSKLFDYFLDNLSGFFGTFLTSIIIFLAGLSMKGEWLMILVHFMKQFGLDRTPKFTSERFHDIHIYLIQSYLTSYIIYFGVCGFLQWYFYIRQRDTPENWKCQPNKFLSWKDEKFEIILGTINLTIGATISGLLACYTMNGGYTTIYYKISDYGIFYFLISIVLYYIWVDLMTYCVHRMLHLPFFYKKFHKIHHRFKQPTAFSSTAMHPAEFLLMQTFMMIPILFLPMHWVTYIGVIGYVFYYGIIDHSGIKMEAIWPWQPNSLFHDDHHKYFHVNFGFNLTIWDKLQGTYRVKDRVYNENTFYGKGKSLDEATPDELDLHFKDD